MLSLLKLVTRNVYLAHWIEVADWANGWPEGHQEEEISLQCPVLNLWAFLKNKSWWKFLLCGMNDTIEERSSIIKSASSYQQGHTGSKIVRLLTGDGG